MSDKDSFATARPQTNGDCIQELVNQIQELTLELQQKLNLVPNNNATNLARPIPAVPVPVAIAIQTLHVGDRVVITNQYGGNQGSIGTVTRLSTHQVTVRLDRNQTEVRKNKGNVRRL